MKLPILTLAIRHRCVSPERNRIIGLYCPFTVRSTLSLGPGRPKENWYDLPVGEELIGVQDEHPLAEPGNAREAVRSPSMMIAPAMPSASCGLVSP